MEGKNFATSISPWVIMPEALDNFRTDLPPRVGYMTLHIDMLTIQEVDPQAYLEGKGKSKSWDIDLEVQLRRQYFVIKPVADGHSWSQYGSTNDLQEQLQASLLQFRSSEPLTNPQRRLLTADDRPSHSVWLCVERR